MIWIVIDPEYNAVIAAFKTQQAAEQYVKTMAAMKITGVIGKRLVIHSVTLGE